MLTVFGLQVSGNCYKVRLLLEQLLYIQPQQSARFDYRWRELDFASQETRGKTFLGVNPLGKVPALHDPEHGHLFESNAILSYLAHGSPYLPEEPWIRAKVMEWLFFEQYSHEPAIAVARFINKFLPDDHARRAELPALQQRAAEPLGRMEHRLLGCDWFAGNRYTIADIALYAYTHCAEDGGISLAPYRGIRDWLQRVAEQPGHVPMDAPLGERLVEGWDFLKDTNQPVSADDSR